MAAILEPHRHPVTDLAPRPDLRLLAGGRSARPDAARPLVSPASVLTFVAIAVLVMVAFVAIGRGAFSTWATTPPSGAAAPAATAGQTVIVRQGDTLWSIARRLRPTGDIRPVVDQLAAANGGTAIAPGDRLVVPS
ncbi:MAG: hypothetical protein JWM47_2436 [Acidimicrobiales bacterium]|nr:hypothetical protein [Acidimicrobiales bacterium]